MKIIKEFRDFAVKGNVIDLAVGVIVGGAFGKIVSSLVNDVVMPPVGVLIHGIDFKNLKITLSHSANGQPAATLNYGNFIQNVVEFLIIAVVVFLIIKALNAFKKKKEAEPAPVSKPSREELVLIEIRDILRGRS